MRNVAIGDDRSKARLRKTDSVAEQMSAANRSCTPGSRVNCRNALLVRLARHAVDDEVAAGDNQHHADETGQGRHLADEDHGQQQSEHGLVGIDGAEHREVGGSQRVPEEQVTGYRQHNSGQDVRPEIDTQRTERHASQQRQRERGQ